jgi:hypothetical protein
MEGSGPQPPSLWRRLGSWHEDPRLIAWWEARVRGVFRVLPPARMRFVLALIAVGVCVQKALGREKELGGSPAWRLAVLLPILLGLPLLIWLVARALRAAAALRAPAPAVDAAPRARRARSRRGASCRRRARSTRR